MGTIAVVGASLAGLHAAEALRAGAAGGPGYDGQVVVVEASPTLPPDRPPLSKQVLSGEWELAQARLPLTDRLDDLSLDLRLGTAATSLSPADADGRTLSLDDGSELQVEGVVLATGATVRHLPGPTLGGVHALRTGDDALALRADLDAGPARVAVVGAGFIGAEVAATCRGRGLEVTLVEAAPAPMVRVLPTEVGSFVADLHRDQGVDVRLGTGVDRLEAGDDGRVRAVHLADGSVVEADVVVVGIGVVPSTGWLDGSDLQLGNGVVCDATMLAGPRVVACGEVACWPNPHLGEEMRVEHWENAVEQGAHAGRRLLDELAGRPGTPFGPVPWFWSDQYDRKIQLAGRPAPTDEFVLVDGTVEERRFAALFRRGDRCTAVLGVNRPRQVMQARMKLAESLAWDDVAAIFAPKDEGAR
ncbi:MAG: NAD(P)/FAD-dependent oxidoreductase [Actinomycetes bacterium]